MGQDGGHDRDELQQAIAEALQGTPVRAGEFLLDDRLVEVAEHAVPGEELVAVSGPGILLHDAAEIAVVGPAEQVLHRAPMQGGQVLRERCPGALAIIACCKCLEQDQLVSHREDVRGLQTAGSTQGS